MSFLDIVASLIALIILEIVLGIDNLVFLSILTEKLPLVERRSARRLGLMFAWVTRLLLLASAVWIVRWNTPFFTLGFFSFSVRNLFLLAGGAFLLVKATQEIHLEVEGVNEYRQSHRQVQPKKMRYYRVIMQVGIMDVIFSLDSVLTAIGLTSHFWIMALAITCAVLVMIYASEFTCRFIAKYPSIKMLALSFLMLIGTALIADSFAFHIPRGYIYFSMAFSLSVETLNLLRRHRKRKTKHADS